MMHSIILIFVYIFILNTFTLVSGIVTQCYHCNSIFCGDNYDARFGAVLSCSDLYNNANLLNAEKLKLQILDGNFSKNKSEDVEIIEYDSHNLANNSTASEKIIDFKRKIWELFNLGQINQNTQYVCVKANYISNSGETATYRGCLPKSTKSYSTACDFVDKKVTGPSSGTVQSCNSCDYNLCNSAIINKNLSTSLIIITLILAAAMKTFI